MHNLSAMNVDRDVDSHVSDKDFFKARKLLVTVI